MMRLVCHGHLQSCLDIGLSQFPRSRILAATLFACRMLPCLVSKWTQLHSEATLSISTLTLSPTCPPHKRKECNWRFKRPNPTATLNPNLVFPHPDKHFLLGWESSNTASNNSSRKILAITVVIKVLKE